MIYTTYFANLRNLPDNIIPIAICGKSPNWYNGLEYKKLAPKYGFFMEWKQNHDNDYYVKCFKEQVLDKLDILSVLRELIDLGGTDIALVCYEKPDDFCHRHLVSEWLRENDINVKEFIKQ